MIYSFEIEKMAAHFKTELYIFLFILIGKMSALFFFSSILLPASWFSYYRQNKVHLNEEMF